MPLFKVGCRGSDRTQIKKLDMEGMKPARIAELTRVSPGIIEKVLSGEWDAEEKLATKRQQELNAERVAQKATAEENRIAQAVAAAMKAMQSVQQVMPAEQMREQLKAEVRAELEAEKPKRKRRTKAEIEADSDAA